MAQATDRTTSPEDRLLAAFSCLNRLDRELAMLAVHAEASVSERRAEEIEETMRAVMTVRLHLRSATRGWLDDPRMVRDAEKLTEASHYLSDFRDTDTDDERDE